MSEDLLKHEIERELLLRILLAQYPQEVSWDELRRRLELQVNHAVETRTLAFYVSYLAEAKYVERMSRHRFEFVKITKKGIDLLDKRIDADPGVTA